MLNKLALVLVALILVNCSSKDKTTQATTTKPITPALKEGQYPLEDFFRNPVVRNVTISPNGEWMMALKAIDNRMNVHVKKADGTGDWQPLTTIKDRDIASAFWKGNNTIVFSKDFGGDENFHVFSVNVTTKEMKDLTPFPNTRVEVEDDLEDVSETDIMVGMNKRDAKVFDLYRLNTSTGQLDLVVENKAQYASYVIDHAGVTRMAISTDGVNYTYYYRDNDKAEFKKIKTLSFKDQLHPLAFDKDNKNVFATSNLDANTAAAVTMNPKTGKVLKTLFREKNYDVIRLNYSKNRKELISASYMDWKTRHHFFSKYYKDIHSDLQKNIPNREIQLNSSNKAEDKFIVAALSDRTGPQYYLYEVKTKKLSHLFDGMPWIKEADMAEVKPITYKTRDGLTIQGYLTLPKGKMAKNLPVVVNPHGGPWARDYWAFNPQVQFLANRGYAVFQMNFRGSTGFGKKFWMSSFKQWGLTMQNDITDGVNWLVKEGVADKSRIAIYGGSYGGYATLAGLAFTPDLYRCGIDYVGVSNIFTLLETMPPYWMPMREMFYEMVGHPEKDKELLTKASPLFSADKIKAPLFVVQGAKDPRVKKSESDQIVDALKKRGVDVPYLVKDNEGHGFRNEENRFDFMRQAETFLAKHMTPDAPMAAPVKVVAPVAPVTPVKEAAPTPAASKSKI